MKMYVMCIFPHTHRLLANTKNKTTHIQCLHNKSEYFIQVANRYR